MKKKGFTLIELLAVIVVLAIILVLAVPKILEIIENAEKQAYKESAELMAHTAQIQYQTKEVTGSAPVIPDEGIVYTFEEGVQTVSGNYDLLKFKGDKPYSGTITLTKDKKVIIEKLVSKNKKWCAIKEAGEKQARVGRSTDPEFACIVEEDQPIKDEKECELEQDKDDENIFYVDSPSDLYALSLNIKNGEKYNGKIIKLRNNLDMSDTSNTCGEDSFTPIGTSYSSFRGTFNGQDKTISNLNINKPSDDSVGVFGYVYDGSVFGLKFKNITIVGDENVGIIGQIAGSNSTKAYAIEVYDSTITGNNYVGGIVGKKSVSPTIREIILDGISVISQKKSGGAVGYQTGNGTVSNIIIRGEKSFVKGETVGWLFGDLEANSFVIKNSIVEELSMESTYYMDISSTSTYHTYRSNKCKLNNTVRDGSFDSKDINDINFYEAAGLDTWIGGDNNSTGYYFDYDDTGKIVLKNKEKYPFPDSTKILKNGSGTKDDPYLIKTEEDWKKVAADAGYMDKYYKLDANLDFSNKKYYMLGSYTSGSNFKTVLNGNDKTLNNIEINGSLVDNLGLIGYVKSGIVYGLKINNIIINGNNNVGIFGYIYDNSKIYAITAEHVKITGNSNVGGIVGKKATSSLIYEILLNDINIVGKTNAGGAVGYQTGNGKVSNIIIRGDKSFAKAETVGWLFGVLESNTTVYAPRSSIVEELSMESTYFWDISVDFNTYRSTKCKLNDKVRDGSFDSKDVNDINFYESAGLDTWIGGDDNSSGYYFDYDDTGKIILKSTEKYPFPDSTKILKNGSGTKDDPYLIKNEEDWKKVAATAGYVDIYYKLDSNLDFSNKKYYMLGSYTNGNDFKTVLNGNDKTISNIEINGSFIDNLGLIGYVNAGTIYGLRINKITITGKNNIGIFGYVNGYSSDNTNIYAITAEHVKITGNNNVGGIVGKKAIYPDIFEVVLDDINIIGKNYVGGAVGYQTGNTTVRYILIKNGTIHSDGTSGWLNGYLEGYAFAVHDSIVENIEMETSSYYDTSISSFDTYHSTACTINGNSSGTFDSSRVNDIYFYKNVLETLFSGDVNNTGYFFDYVEEKGGIYLVKAYKLTPPSTDTGENVGPSTGVCSKYPCTCECGCICNDGSDGATQTRCEAGCN